MKLLITVRNPIELAYSQYISDWNSGTININFEQALKDEPKFVYECSYSNFLDTYYQTFDKSKILILDFEALQTSPSDYIRSVCEFLNVTYLPELSEIPVFNQSSQARLKIFGILASTQGARSARFSFAKHLPGWAGLAPV